MARISRTRIRKVNSDEIHGYDDMDFLDAPRQGKRAKDSRHPRAGKWSAEEENFAYNLIQGFETGTLNDCEEGKSLRSYLATKLHCAPMRISKKFAGKCIGKLIYSKNPLPLSRLGGVKPSSKARITRKVSNSKRDAFNDDMLSYTSSDNGKSTSSSSSSGNEASENSDDYSADEEHEEPNVFIKRQRLDSFSERIRQQSDIAHQPQLSITPSTSYVDLQDLAQGIVLYDSNFDDQQRIDAEADEWKAALSYFCGADDHFFSTSPPKTTLSSCSLNVY